jgi:hypothetical protein
LLLGGGDEGVIQRRVTWPASTGCRLWVVPWLMCVSCSHPVPKSGYVTISHRK